MRHFYFSIVLSLLIQPLWAFQTLTSAQDVGSVYLKLDDALQNPKEAEALDLSQQSLEQLPSEVFSLSKVKKIDLYGNDLTTLPTRIKHLENLEEINLSENKNLDLKDAFTKLSKLPKLKKLYLGGNDFTQLPEEVSLLDSLEVLDLYWNNLSDLPASIIQLKNLKEIYLQDNQFYAFPSKLLQHPSVEIIDLFQNHIRVIPQKIENLGKLRVLNLNHNDLDSLTHNIGKLQHLEELYLNANPKLQLDEICKILAPIKSLKVLNFSENRLGVIPDNINQISSLEELYIQQNNITKLPDQLKGLQNLKILYISDNNLMSASKSIAQLHNLHTLDISNNPNINWKQLFIILKDNRQLRKLLINRCKIHDLPDEIGLLKQLYEISAAQNEMTHCSNQVAKLLHLQRIDLQNNYLSVIPSFKNLKKIKEVYLSNNLFTNEEQQNIKQSLPWASIFFE